MSVESGQNALLYIGAGTYAGSTVASTQSIVGATNIVHRTSGSYISDGFTVGMVAHVTGFSTNGASLHGIVTTVAATDLTLAGVIDDDGNAVTLVDEAAGASITVKGEKFNKVKGQKDTRMSGAGNAIDTSNKDTGGFGSSIAGNRNQTVTVSGVVNWPDATGVELLRSNWEAGTRPWCKLLLNAAGKLYYGQYAITQFDAGGAFDSATEYSSTLNNSIKPTYV